MFSAEAEPFYLFFIPNNEQKCPTFSGSSLTILMFLMFVWLFWNSHTLAGGSIMQLWFLLIPLFMMLSFFLFAFWPQACPLWRNVSKSVLPSCSCLFCCIELEEFCMFWMLIPCQKHCCKLLSDKWTIFLLYWYFSLEDQIFSLLICLCCIFLEWPLGLFRDILGWTSDDKPPWFLSGNAPVSFLPHNWWFSPYGKCFLWLLADNRFTRQIFSLWWPPSPLNSLLRGTW